MKICLIRQPAGLGDILFTYKIAKKIIESNKADIVYWPVITEYAYLNEYLIDEKIIFVDVNTNFPFKSIYDEDTRNIVNTEDLLYVPLQRADQIVPFNPETCNYFMYCKYELIGLDYSDWYAFVNITRNIKNEQRLLEYFNYPSDYTLVNKTVGAPPNDRKITTIPDLINSIEMKIKPTFNFFDWCVLFKNAKEIHTVETSLCYLLTLFSCKNVTVYSRHMPGDVFYQIHKDFKYIKNIYPKTWKYISE